MALTAARRGWFAVVQTMIDDDPEGERDEEYAYYARNEEVEYFSTKSEAAAAARRMRAELKARQRVVVGWYLAIA